jgi:hypothetical protein
MAAIIGPIYGRIMAYVGEMGAAPAGGCTPLSRALFDSQAPGWCAGGAVLQALLVR